MSIRYRLLLIVGLVTTCVFVLVFALENKLFLTSLAKVRKEAFLGEHKLIEKRREVLEDQLYNRIAKKLAQINALLETVSQYPSLSRWFSPSEQNLKLGTWTHAANFLQSEDWVQFLQNTSGSKVLSLIIPEEGPFFEMESVSIEEGIAWVYVLGSPAYPDPFVGIRLPFKTEEADASSLPISYVLYTVNQLRLMDESSEFLSKRSKLVNNSIAQGYDIDEVKFYEYLLRATQHLQDPQIQVPARKPVPVILDDPENQYGRLPHQYLQKILEYSSELFLIREASILRDLGFLQEKEGQIIWPDAMTFAPAGEERGKVFFLKPTLGGPKPLFDDQKFYAENPPLAGSFVSSGSVVIKSPHPNQVFLANTVALRSQSEEGKKESFLSIGYDLSDLLYEVTSITGRYGCLIRDGKVLAQSSPIGGTLNIFDQIPQVIETQKELSGFFILADKEYFFLKVRPDSTLDFYMLFFLPKQEEFSYLLGLQSNIRQILQQQAIHKAALAICSLLVLWLLLLNVSKKITKPIVSLSSALKYVKTGNWSQIKIPKVRYQKNNEIAQLVSSFQDMVDGLKEKEKVSGILNKVVSKEIAQEILKGDVHLGGEERFVSILFADIRGFTQLTQNMLPHEVIELLNTCMTKLSQPIEENKGVIDKYLGDGIMALYGAPLSYKESPLYAVISGLEMIAIMQEWDEERVKEGKFPLDIGIGIHTGNVCAGNMGALNRLNYTVIGSNVNLASRLCYAAGGGELLITAATYEDPSVHQNVEVEDKGMMTFKGFDEQCHVYRVIGLKDPNIGKVLILQDQE